MNIDLLKPRKQFHQVSNKPKIFLKFDDYDNTILQMDVVPVSKKNN